MHEAVIGIDVGGTKIAAVLMTLDGVVAKRIRVGTERKSDYLILRQIGDLIEELLSNSVNGKEHVLGVGIGVPGAIDKARGIAITASNLPWAQTDICTPLQKQFGLAVFLENDANAAALGEYYFGCAKGTKTFVFISLGTGIGGGIILNGELLCDQGQAEVGHIVVDWSGPDCRCGDRGCIEAIASGLALGNAFRRLTGSQNQTIDGKYVLRAAAEGDEVAFNIVTRAARAIAQGIVALERVLSPELFVMGGGLMNMGEFLLPLIRREIEDIGSAAAPISNRVVPSKLVESAGEYGAACLAMRELRHERRS